MTQRARIVGVGRYVPEKVLTNFDMMQFVETSDEWIVERTGIKERRVAADTETTSTMAIEAARRALASANLDGADVDLVVTGTCTPDGMFPAVSSLVQNAIGATKAATFDVNSACTGFLSALSAASQFIKSGQSKRAVVIGAETMTRILDWTDRSTCVLFGDGAGAVVLEAGVEGEPGNIDSLLLRSDGSQAGLLYATGPCTIGDALSREAKITMYGSAIFKQAVIMMAEATHEVLENAGLTVADIDLIVPHQANRRIITALADRMGVPAEKVFINVQKYGNTSSATIPIALAEAVAEGRLEAGDHVLFTAFGGGLTWGSVILEWADIANPAAALGADVANAVGAARG